ncbi:hypothetical protein ACB094_09G155900 [Castanea mollissima]
MVKESGKNVNNKSPKIQKVIFLLRNDKDFEKYYEPRVISLGSIPHCKPKYQLGEKYKLVLTSEFIASSGKSMEEVHKKIQDNIKELRDCYEKKVTMDNNDELIYCASTKDKFKDLSIKDDSVAFRHQDLLLLENQLPYCLLECLMSLSKMKKQLEDSINTFIESEEAQDQSISLDIREPQRMHMHLLDKLRTRLLANHGGQMVYLIYLETQNDLNWQSYRNIQELQAAVFQFDNEYGVTSFISFLDSLIDEANDVTKLRKAGILYNLLGSDQEVTQLFNEIGTDLISQAIHDHFSSPWTILAFLGAFLALSLSFVQTWYTVP